MYALTRVNVKSLDEQARTSLKALTEPQYYCCLSSLHPLGISRSETIAIIATWFGEPIGLLLASFIALLSSAEVHSLFVKEQHRCQKIGGQLLALLERELQQEKCRLLSLAYQADTATASAIEKITHYAGWSTPFPFLIRCYYELRTFDLAWLHKTYRISADFQQFPWHSLQPCEKERIKFQQKQGVFSASVSPFGEENSIEPINSLGLRYKGEVVGWIITHRIAFDTIRYSALYIHREFQSLGYSMMLLRNAIQLHKDSVVERALFEVNVLQSDFRWVHFIRRRLIPQADAVIYMKRVCKHLVIDMPY